MENKSALSKTLKPHWVVAIAFGSSIGWGAIILPVDWISEVGPLGVILGILICALLVMVIATSYGYLVKNIPVSGREFIFNYLDSRNIALKSVRSIARRSIAL